MVQYTNKAYYISPSGKLVTQTYTYTIKNETDVLTKVELKQERS